MAEEKLTPEEVEREAKYQAVAKHLGIERSSILNLGYVYNDRHTYSVLIAGENGGKAQRVHMDATKASTKKQLDKAKAQNDAS